MAQYLVLDIGGTFIKYAIMDGSANFIEQGKVPAKTGSEQEMLASLADVREAVASFDYEGVAISMPGRIDTARGWAHTGGAFVWLSEYPAAEKYGAIFGKPCTIANDGKCAALAESWTGALADVDSGAVIVLGTGIGGGIVLNGKVWMGCSGGAGELSWLVTDYLLLSDEDAAHVSPVGIYGIQSVLDLPRYAIGGGISARPETTTLIREGVDRIFALRKGLPFSKPEIVTCKFGNEANLIGALAFHLKQA